VIPKTTPAADGDGDNPKEAEEESGNLVIPQDHVKAARLWAEAAGPHFGDKGAVYNYAQCLLRGHGVPGAFGFVGLLAGAVLVEQMA
jgi:hypothetical protein